MPTFTGETLTETGLVRPGVDVINPDDPKLGFGHLITNDGGVAIQSSSPFASPPNPISGLDVKWVHGNRWQELQGFMTENVAGNFTTTIGAPPPSGGKGYYNSKNDPTSNASAADDFGQGLDPWGLDAPGGIPASSSDEKSAPDPGVDGLFSFPKYTLNVQGDQTTMIGGDTSLFVAGYGNTVHIGRYSASYFSQYITNTGDSNYHNVPDSYVEMNNDYKKVDATKFRNVHMKQDIAQISLGLVEFVKAEFKTAQVAGALGSVNAWGVHLGLGLLKSKTYTLQESIHTSADVKPKVNAGPSVGVGTPFR